MRFMGLVLSVLVLALPWIESARHARDGNAKAGCSPGSGGQCPEPDGMNPFPELIPTTDVKDKNFDSVVIVTDQLAKLTENLQPLRKALEIYAVIDKGYGSQPVLLSTNAVASGRLIYANTGLLNRDYDDVRRFADAAKGAMKRALSAGSKRPLLVVPVDDFFEKAEFVAALAALEVVYVPLELREIGVGPKIEALGIWSNDKELAKTRIGQLDPIERGRIIARDIGGSDPERMSPPQVEKYLRREFDGTDIVMTVISDIEQIRKEYPLAAAVNRAAHTTKRHRARIVFMEYNGSEYVNETLFLVGKGITYDTGGANIKTGGSMVSMHRDKCGAAAVAGFMKALSILKPRHLRVVAGMPFVRNSVGEESYVADEIITSRAGVRIRVGNTDCEGRMIMADVLCKMKEMAIGAFNAHLYTIATLTGHAIRAVGPYYSIILDNGPAKQGLSAEAVQEAGDKYGDPFEISTIRREDYDFHKGKSGYEDVLQSNNKPTTSTNRGHQSPSAFLIMASGLDKHGIDSDLPLRYSNIDIASSANFLPALPSGAPVVAFSAKYLL